MTLASTERFGTRVDAYVRARPGYPDAVAHFLRDAYVLGDDAQIADIGAGTGLSSRPFLAAGLRVAGVEPNAPMRAASMALSERYPGYRAVDGTAEATGLADASVDLALAGQALHWFEPQAFRRELLRVLKPEGVLALMWNSRRHDASKFMRDYDDLLLAHCPEYRARWEDDDVGAKYADAMTAVFGANGWRSEDFPNAQTLDRAGLLARLDSASYAPPPGDPAHAPMMAAVNALFDRHASDGAITLIYRTRLFHGRLRRAPDGAPY